jgi:hypothetical protein
MKFILVVTPEAFKTSLSQYEQMTFNKIVKPQAASCEVNSLSSHYFQQLN